MEIWPWFFMLSGALVLMRFAPIWFGILVLWAILREKVIKKHFLYYRMSDILKTFCAFVNAIIYGVMGVWWTIHVFPQLGYIEFWNLLFYLMSILYIWIVWIVSFIALILQAMKIISIDKYKMIYIRRVKTFFVVDTMTILHFIPLVVWVFYIFVVDF